MGLLCFRKQKLKTKMASDNLVVHCSENRISFFIFERVEKDDDIVKLVHVEHNSLP